MPAFTALIHADAGAAHLARLLETVRAADEVVVVDHLHDDATRKVAHQYGARLVHAVAGVQPGAYAVDCRHDWVLCLQASESFGEALEAALLEWKRAAPQPGDAFAIAIREQQQGEWRMLEPETRLVNRTCVNWQGKLPPSVGSATTLGGFLLRFPEPA